MKNSLETKLGYFVVLVVFAAWIIMETLGGMELLHGGYHVNALFNTAQELKVGDSVKMAGVEIGRVEKIALADADEKVKVTMKLHPDAVVKTDSKATIKFTGLMGQNFVAINFGSPSAPVAIDGAVLATEEQPDLNAVMAKLNDAATASTIWRRVSAAPKLTICSARSSISSNKTAATLAAPFPTLTTSPARSPAGRAPSAR